MVWPRLPEGGRVFQLPDEGELLGASADRVPDAGDVGAVDPPALPAVVQVWRQLLPDCVVQFLVVLCDHGLLAHLVEYPSTTLDGISRTL